MTTLFTTCPTTPNDEYCCEVKCSKPAHYFCAACVQFFHNDRHSLASMSANMENETYE